MQYSKQLKSVPAVFLDGWLVRLEKWAFGWVCLGNHTETSQYETTERKYDTVNIDGESHSVSYNQRVLKTKITKYLDFYRVSPYSYNVLFGILELISGIFSTIRRWAMYLVDIVLAFLLGLSIICLILQAGDTIAMAAEIIGPFLILYASLVVLPSLLLAGIALILRKAFQIDKKLESELIMQGLNPDWKSWY